MSRNQPNPQNQQTLRALSRVEANRQCADCKRNKHPRWASWNLGIFVCIRCSGIHRGMGTHISRVKSVDLDAWTDEQTQQMLRWGNSRANKYWEAKLAPGHIPAEAKIENFIRTKYESKRWVMEGGMPDPATLDDTGGDDEVPLNVVQEKAKLDRSASLKAASVSSQPASLPTQSQSIDLFGDEQPQTIARPHTTAPPANVPTAPTSQGASPPKPARAADSLLGFDFFGSTPNEPSRPSSATPSHTSTGSISRPDLKQSILSLYANTPKATTPAAAPSTYHQRNDSNPLADLQPSGAQTSPSGSSTQASLNDAFSGLSFSSGNTKANQTASRPSAFSELKQTSFNQNTKQNPQSVQKPLSGGSFFDAKPTSASRTVDSETRRAPNYTSPVAAPQSRAPFSSSTAPSPASATSTGKSVPTGDLLSLDFSSPPATTTSASTSKTFDTSPFNLSAQPKAQPVLSTSTATTKSAPVSGTTGPTQGFASLDPWGSSDVWSTSNTAPSATTIAAPSPIPNNSANVWGDDPAQNRSPPQNGPNASTVTADEDFGGWAKSPAATSSVGSSQPKPLTGFNEDLFSNVWE